MSEHPVGNNYASSVVEPACRNPWVSLRAGAGAGRREVIDDTVSRVSQLSVLAQSLASAPDEDARLTLAVQAA